MNAQGTLEKRRILFVDDEQSILDGLRNRLRKKRDQWDMRFALGGKDALAQLATERFDIIVTDMRMPGMDGAEVTKQIRDRLNMPNLVVIALTADATRESQQRSLAAGMNDYLTKPVRQRDLYELLSKWA